MATVLGDLLQVNPQTVTTEEFYLWTDRLLIDSERSFLGADEIVKEMCQEPGMWDNFLIQLEEAEETITRIVYQEKPESRLYLDWNKNPYFWVYPEEIFPRPNTGK